LLIEEIYTSLDFEEFWRELGMLEISLCWDICPLSFIFLFLFFQSTQASFGNIDGGSNKNIWSFIG
jgi:hypothetical protein